MPVLVRIALRNLREHVSKSVIIGSLIVLGVVVIVLGNSLLDATERGVHRMFIDNYTGDVFVSGIPRTPGAAVSLFGVTSGTDAETPPVLVDFDAIEARFRQDPRVSGVTGQLTGVGMVTRGDEKEMSAGILFGVDPASYPGMFRGTFLVEGRHLEPGEDGLVVSRKWLERTSKRMKEPLAVGDRLTITGVGQAGFKIREVTVVGVVDFAAETEGMDMIVWANADTVRILSGVDVSAEDVVLSAAETALLDAGEEDIFGAAESTVDAASTAPTEGAPRPAEPERASAAAAGKGSWHFLLARLESSRGVEAFIAETNAWFAS